MAKTLNSNVIILNLYTEFVFISVTKRFPRESVTIPTKLFVDVFVIVVTLPAGIVIFVVAVKLFDCEIKACPPIHKYLYLRYPDKRVISRRIVGPRLTIFKNFPAAISFADATFRLK